MAIIHLLFLILREVTSYIPPLSISELAQVSFCSLQQNVPKLRQVKFGDTSAGLVQGKT